MKQVFGIMPAMKRKIPYGIMNWAEVVRECYFVDSTAYIRALEDVKTPVFLRPKRFGKSLWCSMLGYYYDVNCKDRFDELFGRTEIGRDPTPLANAFLVLTFENAFTLGIPNLTVRNMFVDLLGRDGGRGGLRQPGLQLV